MPTYRLYLESGPKHRKTMVHLLDLLGCTANGPTTEAALEATPAVISAYLRLLARAGEDVDPSEPFEIEVAEHTTEGQWLGNGSPDIIYGPEFEAVSEACAEVLLHRFHVMRAALATWAESQTDEALDAKPPAGRSARAILKHLAAVPGAYFSAVAGGAPGFSRIGDQVERDVIRLPDALRQVDTMIADLVHRLTPEQRNAVLRGPGQIRTARKAFRRMLEHDWEHLLQLSRRPGGPEL